MAEQPFNPATLPRYEDRREIRAVQFDGETFPPLLALLRRIDVIASFVKSADSRYGYIEWGSGPAVQRVHCGGYVVFVPAADREAHWRALAYDRESFERAFALSPHSSAPAAAPVSVP